MFLFEKITKLEKMDVDDFLDDIEKNGLFGYDVFKDISREDLRNELLKGVDLDKFKKPINESYLYESESTPLAVRLGLRTKEQLKVKGKEQSNAKPNNTSNQNTSVNNGEQNIDDDSHIPQSYKDRLQAEKEKRELAKLQREEKKRQLEIERQNRLAKNTFKGKEQNDVENDKTEDKVNKRLSQQLGLKYEPNIKPSAKKSNGKEIDDDIEKQLADYMNSSAKKKKSDIDDIEQRLADRMKSSAKQTDDLKDIESKLANKMRDIKPFNRLEYSKKTLLAIADRMDFVVYCKFIKKNKEKRTGRFKITGTKSQITPKLDTIVVKDIDLPEPKNWRTIPLDRILEIRPI